jgi:hypothetical protein
VEKEAVASDVMARLVDLQEQIELNLKLLEREYDPFQLDLEWFKYELAVKVKKGGHAALLDAEDKAGAPAYHQRHATRGRINRKDLSILLTALDDLIRAGEEVRFEPYDLNFYMEWKLETPHVYSIVTWFDMALSPRDLNSRFPSAHLGFRFLAEEDSLRAFRSGLATEFMPPSAASDPDATARVN